MKPVIVITGASSGIGKSTAEALVKRACTVYDLSRRDMDSNGIVHITTDVTDEVSVRRAIDEIIRREGQIDVLVNNAGFGISGAVEFTETADAERLLDVNFFGTVRVTRAVLPHMRMSGKGRVVNVSSVAAVAPIPYQTFYSASKSAIMTYTMALANEVGDFGITACAVLPGDIRTGFTGAREKSAVGDDVYGGKISRSVKKMEQDEQGGMPPEKAAKKIASIVLSNSKKPLYTIGFDYQCLTVLIKLLPSGLVNRIIKLLYAN